MADDNYDEKIVSLKFDNSKFESNAKATLNTLGKLEESLKFTGASAGLETLGKAADKVSFDSMSKSIETVSVKFRAMDAVVFTALQDITKQAIVMGKQLVKSLTIAPLSGGWAQYEEKTKAVQTIIASTGKSMEEVDSSLEKLIFYADETSYSFSDMITNIGKFTSMGIDLDDSVTAMEGISNWAALSGQGINEAGRAMYNLSQAMGTGSVKLIDWKSIENANMGTKEFKEQVIATAKELGTLSKESKTAKGTLVDFNNFSSTLAEGWFSSDVLLEVLKKYGGFANEVFEYVDKNGGTASDAIKKLGTDMDDIGVKSFLAAQQAITFKDAINSVSDAVKSGWANVFEIIFGNFEQSKELWTDMANTLWDIFAAPISSLGELLGDAFGSGGGIQYDAWIEFRKNAELTNGELKTFQTAIVDTAKANNVSFDESKGIIGLMEASALTSDLVNESLNNLVKGKGFNNADSVLQEYLKLSQEIWDNKWGNGQDRWTALTEAGYDWATAQSIVDKQAQGLEITVADLSDELLSNIGLTEKEIEDFRNLKLSGEQADSALSQLFQNGNSNMTRSEKFSTGIMNIIYAISSYIDIVKEAWHNIFPSNAEDTIKNIVDKFYDFTTKLQLNEEAADRVKRTLQGVFSVVSLIWETIKNVFAIGKSFLSGLIPDSIDGISNTTATIGDFITNVVEAIKNSETLKNVFGFLNKVAYVTGSVIGKVVKAIGDFIAKIPAFIEEFKNDPLGAIKSVFEALFIKPFSKENLKKASDGIRKGLVSIFGEEIGNGIVDKLTGLYTKISTFFSNFFKDPLGTLKSGFDALVNFFKGIDLGQIWNNFKQGIADKYGEDSTTYKVIAGIGDAVSKAYNWIKDNVTAAVNWFKSTGIYETLSKWIRKIKDLFKGDDEESDSNLSFFDKLKNGITNAFDKIKTAFSSLIEKVKPIWQWIQDHILSPVKENAENGTIGSYLLKGAGIFGIISFIKSIIDLKRNGLFGTKGLLTALTGEFDAFAANNRANALLKLAAAIGIIAASIFALCQVDTKKFLIVTAALALFATIMGFIAKSLTKTRTSSIKSLTFFDTLKESLSSFLQTISTSVKHYFDSLSLVNLGLALLALAGALSIIGNMDIANIAKGVGAIAAVLASIMLYVNLTKNHRNSLKVDMLVKMALAIDLLAVAIMILGGLKVTTLLKGTLGILGIMLALGLFTKLANGTEIKKISGSLIGIAVVVGMLTASLYAISILKTESIIKGLIGLAAIMGLLITVLAVVKNSAFTTTGLAPMMLGFAGAVAIMAIAFAILSGISWDGILKGVLALASLAAAVIAFKAIGNAVGNFAGIAAVGKGLLVFFGTIALVTAGLYLIGSAVDDGTVQAIDRAGAVIEAIGIALGKLIGGILGGLITGIADPIMDSLPDWGTKLSQWATNMSDFFTAINIFAEAMPKDYSYSLGGWLNNKRDMGVYSLSIVSFVTAMANLANDISDLKLDDVSHLSDVSEKIVAAAEFYNGLAKDMPSGSTYSYSIWGWFDNKKDLGYYGNDIKSFAEKMFDIVSKLDESGLAVEDFQNFVVDSELIKTATETYTEIASKLPTKDKYSYTLFGWFSNKADLGKFGGDIKEFVTNMITVCEGLQDLDTTVIDAAKGKSDQLKDVISIFIGIADSVADLGLKGYDFSPAYLALTPTLSLSGKTNIVSFASQVEPFMSVMKAAAENIQKEGDIPNITEQLNAVNTIMTTFITLAESLPEDYDYNQSNVSWIMDMRDFNAALSGKDEKPNLLTFASHISGVYSSIKTSAEEIAKLGDIPTVQDNLNTMAEVLGTFITLAKELPLYTDYDYGLQPGEGKNGFENALLFFKNFASVEVKASLSGFGSQIDTLVTEMNTASEKAKTYDSEAVGKVVTAVEDFVDIASSLSSLGTNEGENGYSWTWLDAFINNEGNIELFGSQIGDLATQLQTASGVSINTDQLETIRTQLTTFASIFSTITTDGGEGGKNYAGAMWITDMLQSFQLNENNTSQAVSDLSSFISTWFTTISACFDDGSSATEIETKFQTFGTNCLTNFLAALQGSDESGNTPSSIGESIGASVYDSLAASADSFYTAGVYAITGFINGMLSQSSSVYSIGNYLASTVVSAVNSRLQVNSPSKVMEQTGAYIDQGLANGISKGSGLVDVEADKMASNSLSVIQSYVEMLYDMMDNEINMDPVITPVFDFSEIQNGAGAINGMLKNNYDVGVTGRLAKQIGSGMSSKSNSYTPFNDSNVINSIASLGSRVDMLSEVVGSMQVILDGDKVVGGLIKRINNGLETINNKNRRGVM